MFDRYMQFLHETPEAGAGGEAPAEGGDGGAELQGANGTVDLGPIMQRLDETSERLSAMDERLGGGEQEWTNPYESEEDAAALGVQEQPQAEPVEDAEQAARMQALQEFVDSRLKEQFGGQFDSLNERLTQQDIYSRAVALEEEFPELKDPEVAGPLYQECLTLGKQLGMTELQARDPEFAELVYRAGRNTSEAAGETPAGEQERGEVQLEAGAGGAAPSREEDPAMSIVNAGPARSFLTGG